MTDGKKIDVLGPDGAGVIGHVQAVKNHPIGGPYYEATLAVDGTEKGLGGCGGEGARDRAIRTVLEAFARHLQKKARG